jgi:peroxiredoxin
MPRFRLALILLAALTTLTPRPGWAADPPGKAGKNVEFELKDSAGKVWSLATVKESKVVVVVFVGTECPVNNAYMPRLVELHKEFKERGVAFVAINANSQDTPERVAEHAKKHELTFPVLKDPGNAVADQFEAKRTPEAFVLDGERRVRYRGRIDDQFGIGFNRPKPTRRDLAEALDEVLAGKPVTTAATEAPGCLIARESRPKGEAKVTYAKDVARVFQARCQECHRPGQIGPMSLLSYSDANAWSETIREVVQERRMPPWHADPKHGQFANDRSLSAKERDTILAWIDGGCAKGEEKDLPKPKEFADGWRIGKPDVVFTMTKAETIPARAARGVPYRYAIIQTDFAEDRWVQAAEAKPGNAAVVHHIIVYVAENGKRPGQGEDGIGNGWLAAHAPGDLPSVFEPGAARKLPKGAALVFQLHYTPNGTEQSDKSSVGLIFAKEPPRHEVHTRAIAGRRFLIPAGADNHKVVSSTTFRDDALLFTLLPHMHLRGKDFEYKAIFPDGKEQVLLSVPHYDFNWQSNYRLAKPLALPAGTRIECTAHFDNSEKNRNNPDPTKSVSWGDQTWQEMMIGFVDYVYMPKNGDK